MHAKGYRLSSKNALARSSKKRSFSLAFLQDLVRPCGTLQESCRNLVFCKILAQSHKILQEYKEKDLFLEDLARTFLLGYIIHEMKVYEKIFLYYKKCSNVKKNSLVTKWWSQRLLFSQCRHCIKICNWWPFCLTWFDYILF